MRGRLDALEVELVDRRNVGEHAGELCGHPLDLIVGEAQTREPRDVADLLAVDHPVTGAPRGGRSSRSEATAATSSSTEAPSASHSP